MDKFERYAWEVLIHVGRARGRRLFGNKVVHWRKEKRRLRKVALRQAARRRLEK